jgi:hypothetical protein
MSLDLLVMGVVSGLASVVTGFFLLKNKEAEFASQVEWARVSPVTRALKVLTVFMSVISLALFVAQRL